METLIKLTKPIPQPSGFRGELRSSGLLSKKMPAMGPLSLDKRIGFWKSPPPKLEGYSMQLLGWCIERQEQRSRREC